VNLSSSIPAEAAAANGAPGPEFLTVPQVGARLQVQPFTVRRWIWAGKLKACLLGACVRIRRQDLELFVSANTWTPELCQERTARPQAGRRERRKTGRAAPLEAACALGPEEQRN
jgi:excisionase family DNA binding protein